MSQTVEKRRGLISMIRELRWAMTRQSERTILLGTVLLATAVSAMVGFVYAQYFSVDIISSLLFFPEDCFGDWGANIGRHCFSDYSMVVGAGSRPNPWEPYPMFPPHEPYLAAGPPAPMLPHLMFGLPAKWLGAPLLGLVGYQLAMAIAVTSPAIWAARGARGLERVVIFVALSAAAIPAWAVVDRGNSAGFTVPIGLVFLVALCRCRWGLVAITVVLAALVKPQFAVLAVALFAARQWRLGGLALGGVVITQAGAYLLWPRDFPATISQSINNAISASDLFLTDLRNVSFGRALLLAPDYFNLLQTGQMPASFLAAPRSLIGFVTLAVAAILVIALGRRIPPVMVGIVLLATITLSPPLALFYHLVFVLPVAALIVRYPDGPPGTGLFDHLATQGPRRRVVGLCVSLAAALTIVQIALPGPIGYADIPGQLGTRGIVGTTTFLAPFLWLLACTAILVSYIRRPILRRDADDWPPRGSSEARAASLSTRPSDSAEPSQVVEQSGTASPGRSPGPASLD